MFGGSSFGFGKAERGASRRIDSMFAEGFYEGPPRPTTPELRLKDMEMDGVDAEVLYGILGVGMRFDDPELTRYVYNVYYDWAAEFCNTNPGRWAALAPLASHDPQSAAQDLRRAAKLGLKGADFAVSIAVKASLPAGVGRAVGGGQRVRHAGVVPLHRGHAPVDSTAGPGGPAGVQDQAEPGERRLLPA